MNEHFQYVHWGFCLSDNHLIFPVGSLRTLYRTYLIQQSGMRNKMERLCDVRVNNNNFFKNHFYNAQYHLFAIYRQPRINIQRFAGDMIILIYHNYLLSDETSIVGFISKSMLSSNDAAGNWWSFFSGFRLWQCIKIPGIKLFGYWIKYLQLWH